MASERFAAVVGVALAAASCEVVSGLDEIEIVAPGPCDDGLLDRNRDAADGCELVAPIPTNALVLWLSPDFGITESAEGISEWLDQSGRQSDFVQGFPASQPALLTNGLNGLAVVAFDGSQLESKTHLRADFSQGITFCAVVRRDVPGFEDTIFDMVVAGGPSDSKNIYLSQAGAADNLWFGATTMEGNVTITSAGLYTPNAPHLVTIRSAPGSLLFHFDGDDALPLPNLPPTLPVTETLTVMLGSNIAAEDPRYHHGIVAEVVLYERALDDGELAGVEQYLRNKWLFP